MKKLNRPKTNSKHLWIHGSLVVFAFIMLLWRPQPNIRNDIKIQISTLIATITIQVTESPVDTAHAKPPSPKKKKRK